MSTALQFRSGQRLVRQTAGRTRGGANCRLRDEREGAALITPELRKKIERCHNMPSPPGVATKISHLANDQILVTTANILKANVRGADVVAR